MNSGKIQRDKLFISCAVSSNISIFRFLSETECGAAAFLLIVFWLFLGRWTERWIRRDFTRAMIEHINEPSKNSSTLLGRLSLRYKRQWDSICPLFLQRLTYSPQWNGRQMCDLMKHIAFWRSQYLREYRYVTDSAWGFCLIFAHNITSLTCFPICSVCASSIFQATAGRGMMFCNDRWRELDVRDESSRKLLFAVVSSVGSFNSSTPYFWMNLLTVFSCSISLVCHKEKALRSSFFCRHFSPSGYHMNFAGLECISALLGKWNFRGRFWKSRFFVEVTQFGNLGDFIIFAGSGRSFVACFT